MKVRREMKVIKKAVSVTVTNAKETMNVEERDSKKVIWSPNFNKIDLLALYATMRLRNIIKQNEPWKASIDELHAEIRPNLIQLPKEKQLFFLPTLWDYSRIYSWQWKAMLKGENVGHVMYISLLLVLSFKIGMRKLWPTDTLNYREDIIMEFLSEKPNIVLDYLSQNEPLFEDILPLCQDLHRVSLPNCNFSVFEAVIQHKSLRILEFSGGISDTDLCRALWGIGCSSEEAVVMVLKVQEEAPHRLECRYDQNLPNLEVLRCNILGKKSEEEGCLKVSLGSLAILLQSKLRIVENLFFWRSHNCLEYLYLRSDELMIQSTRLRYFEFDHLVLTDETISEIFSPVWQYIIGHSFDGAVYVGSQFNYIMNYLNIYSDPFDFLSLDASGWSANNLQELLSLVPMLKILVVKVSLKILMDFNTVDKYNDGFTSIESLTIEFSEEAMTDLIHDSSKLAKIQAGSAKFISLFRYAKIIKLSNTFWMPGGTLLTTLLLTCLEGTNELTQLFVIASPLANPAMQPKDKHYDKVVVNAQWKLYNDEPTLRRLLQQMSSLKCFQIDEIYLCPQLDSFIELLRASNVCVSIFYHHVSDPFRYRVRSYVFNRFDSDPKILPVN